MMTNIITQTNTLFGEVRFLEVEGKPYAVANDVLKILGYSEGNWHTTLSRKCKKDGVAKCKVIDYLGREQEMNTINEGNMYRLIIGSKLPTAEKFERWIFDEVLPSIRTTGSYNARRDSYTIEDPIDRAMAWIEEQKVLKLAQETVQTQQVVIEEQQEVIEELHSNNEYLENENDRLQAVCNIPKSQLVKDIRCFVNEYVKQVGTAGNKVSRDSMYEAYRFARRSRMEQPCKYTFEDILSHNCKLNKDKFGNWLDVRLNEAKLKRM